MFYGIVTFSRANPSTKTTSTTNSVRRSRVRIVARQTSNRGSSCNGPRHRRTHARSAMANTRTPKTTKTRTITHLRTIISQFPPIRSLSQSSTAPKNRCNREGADEGATATKGANALVVARAAIEGVTCRRPCNRRPRRHRPR